MKNVSTEAEPDLDEAVLPRKGSTQLPIAFNAVLRRCTADLSYQSIGNTIVQLSLSSGSVVIRSFIEMSPIQTHAQHKVFQEGLDDTNRRQFAAALSQIGLDCGACQSCSVQS